MPRPSDAGPERTVVPSPGRARPARERPNGFTLIELLVAIVLFSVGLLGLAGVMAFSVQSVTMADLESKRAVALQTVLEDLRSQPLDSVKAGSDSVGPFAVAWSATPGTRQVEVEVVTEGPGLRPNPGGMASVDPQVADTFVYVIR